MKRMAALRRAGALATMTGLAVLGWRQPEMPESPRPTARDTVDRTWLGASGNIRIRMALPGEVREATSSGALPATVADTPGVYRHTAVAPDGDSVSVATLLPFASKTGALLGRYRIGHWPPGKKGLPSGFIEVTKSNQSTPVSKRFRLSDFLTHDQQGIWPKYLVLQPRLVDKLELIGERLAALGKPSTLEVMSGFRTPQYNAKGVGPLGGRARDSRHTYGDAADIFVDHDGDGRMDDLDGDGRITVADGRFLLAVAEHVERNHPDLIGGLSAYPSTAAHGPFLHVDTRGHRARW